VRLKKPMINLCLHVRTRYALCKYRWFERRWNILKVMWLFLLSKQQLILDLEGVCWKLQCIKVRMIFTAEVKMCVLFFEKKTYKNVFFGKIFFHFSDIPQLKSIFLRHCLDSFNCIFDLEIVTGDSKMCVHFFWDTIHTLGVFIDLLLAPLKYFWVKVNEMSIGPEAMKPNSIYNIGKVCH